MIKKRFKQYLAKQRTALRKNPWLAKHSESFQLTRCSVWRGLSVGVFAAFIPMPIQTITAILLAIVTRGNVILSLIATWLSNPITFVPFNYFIYRVGSAVLQEAPKEPVTPPPTFPIEFTSFHAFYRSTEYLIATAGKAFLVGLPIVAFGAAFLTYFLAYAIGLLSDYFHGNRPPHSSHKASQHDDKGKDTTAD